MASVREDSCTAIEIDDEVYARLEENVKGFEQPNDVLRRLLLEETSQEQRMPKAASHASAAIRGKLGILMEDGGEVKAGDTLTYTQVRKGRTFTAVIEPDGWIKTVKGRYKEPSPALSELVGTSIDGWASWIHQPTGKSLRVLRSEMGGTGRGGH
jgi:hypothetical protein